MQIAAEQAAPIVFEVSIRRRHQTDIDVDASGAATRRMVACRRSCRGAA
jgi:hypothetical protein